MAEIKVESPQDLRDAIQKMADANKVSVTTLNQMAGAGLGILRRYLRGRDRRKLGGVLVEETSETDIKVSVILKTVNAADYELVLRPKPKANRREQVRQVQRKRRGVNFEPDAEVAPQ